MLHEFVATMNCNFKKLITQLIEVDMQVVMKDFKQWCDLLSIQGAINGTYTSISKISSFQKNIFITK